MIRARIPLRFDSVNRQTPFWACKFQNFLGGMPPNLQGAENLLYLSTCPLNRKIAVCSRVGSDNNTRKLWIEKGLQ